MSHKRVPKSAPRSARAVGPSCPWQDPPLSNRSGPRREPAAKPCRNLFPLSGASFPARTLRSVRGCRQARSNLSKRDTDHVAARSDTLDTLERPRRRPPRRRVPHGLKCVPDSSQNGLRLIPERSQMRPGKVSKRADITLNFDGHIKCAEQLE